MRYRLCWIFPCVAACGAADVDETMWESNELGGGDAFAGLQQGPLPTGGGPVPTGGGPAPTGTDPVPTGTGPVPTGTATGPVPTGTATGPVPTGTGPVPTGTATGPVPTGTGPAPTGTVPPPPPGTNSGPCAVSLDFTTVSVNGKYAPRHVEAVWVEDQAGNFIQTLEANGTIRIGNLVAWNGKALGNTVDAITGATIGSHRGHTVTWDCVDLQNAPVPDGTYRIVAEFTEENAGGFLGGGTTQMIAAEFYKGVDPVDLVIPDTNAYRGIVLSYR